ncbi:hypothetical protein [Mycolicibacterium mageritense]|uniref:hypothetical protein n=1 Tax=Mycolicibacterium mageritense TaxID=53462 RepID=UPI001E352A64|nr:hypothetical protein [Mycolicibacterium mageritense]GJJ22327.1 hypothetical protein MTY414_60000 [Mycolicibacterium mageritense]
MSDKAVEILARSLASQDSCADIRPRHRAAAEQGIYALKAARIAVVELAETQIDPDWGDEFWFVPLTEVDGASKYGGKLRLAWKSGPRITQTIVPNPFPVADVDAYVSALLAAKAAAEARR